MQTPSRQRNEDYESQKIEVFCRIAPISSGSSSYVDVIDERTLKTCGSRGITQKETLHKFTSVFQSDASQSEVFRKTTLSLVSDLLDGKNGLLFTYGITGSGKTYSMQGTNKDPGILIRSLDVLFNSIDQYQTRKYVVKPDGVNGFDIQTETDAIMDRHKLDYQQKQRFAKVDVSNRVRESTVIEAPLKSLFAVFISLIEVYNNSVFDLLQENSETRGKILATRVLREDTKRNVYVSGSVEVEVKSADEAISVYTTGLKRRRIGQTSLNAESSRSHCIFIIKLVRTGYDAKYNEAIVDKNLMNVSHLCLVDLAGSERTGRTGTHGTRLREASNINNSLMNLRKCIESLREMQSINASKIRGTATPGQIRVIPYRDTRLTHLFKNFFEGDGRMVMLVCIQCSTDDYDETQHVLKFAELSQEVSTCRILPLTPHRYQLRTKPRSIETSSLSSSASSSMDFQITVNADDNFIFQDLSYNNQQIEHYLKQLSDYISDPHVNFDSEIENDENINMNHAEIYTDSMPPSTATETDQDSAPEPDRQLCKFGKSFDTSALRALLVNNRNGKKKAYRYMESLFSNLTANLADVANELDESRSNNNTNMQDFNSVNSMQNKRLRLEARIHHLESEVMEKNAAVLQERNDRIEQVDCLRKESDRLRKELGKQIRNSSTKMNCRKGENDTRSSFSQSNMVSVLSKQWENRAAQHKAETERWKKCLDNSNSADERRTPAFNPRHRRSRSVGGDNGRWLEHQEVNSVPLGTILSPSLKRQKSVTQIELKDTLKADNYVLHHQEADREGNVETKFYKGSIIPTAGGGSAVIFNDVEILRQRSPLGSEKENNDRHSGIKRCRMSSPDSRHESVKAINHDDDKLSCYSSTSSTYLPVDATIFLKNRTSQRFREKSIEPCIKRTKT